MEDCSDKKEDLENKDSDLLEYNQKIGYAGYLKIKKELTVQMGHVGWISIF